MTLVVVVSTFLLNHISNYNHRRRHDCGANHEINESDLNRKKLYRMIVLRTFLLLVIFGCIGRDVVKPIVSFRFFRSISFWCFISRISSRKKIAIQYYEWAVPRFLDKIKCRHEHCWAWALSELLILMQGMVKSYFKITFSLLILIQNLLFVLLILSPKISHYMFHFLASSHFHRPRWKRIKNK